MRMKSTFLGILIAALSFCGDWIGYHPDSTFNFGECTIGVFSGRATADGRPLLWKNRDVTREIQKFCYYEPSRDSDRYYAYIGNCYSEDTTRIYMGLNEVGFAIINSNSYNLGDSLAAGVDDGILLRMALERCRTLRDFEDLLDLTSVKGRQDCWNIGAFDANGSAALYECSNYGYVKFDANNHLQVPDGIILRATFGLSGGDNNRIGIERLKRANEIVYGRYNEDPINAKFVLQKLSRDLASPVANPYPLPYNGCQYGRPPGFILTNGITINRNNSRSCMVIRGVAEGEDPRLSTVFGSIGPPVLSVAFPLWVESRKIPPPLNIGFETPMFFLVNRHNANLYPMTKDPNFLDSHYLLGPDGNGIFTYTIPLENEALRMADEYIRAWNDDFPARGDFTHAQDTIADMIFEAFLQIPFGKQMDSNPDTKSLPLVENFPNPFNAQTTIHLSGFKAEEPVKISIYDLLGRLIKSYQLADGSGGFVVWDGTDRDNGAISSGVYLIKAENSQHAVSVKALLMK